MHNKSPIILKTDIQSEQKLRLLFPILDNHKRIDQWSVDLEDVDKVLRVVPKGNLSEFEVLQLMSDYGFLVEQLVDCVKKTTVFYYSIILIQFLYLKDSYCATLSFNFNVNSKYQHRF
jgi:hypothetical protein